MGMGTKLHRNGEVRHLRRARQWGIGHCCVDAETFPRGPRKRSTKSWYLEITDQGRCDPVKILDPSVAARWQTAGGCSIWSSGGAELLSIFRGEPGPDMTGMDQIPAVVMGLEQP